MKSSENYNLFLIPNISFLYSNEQTKIHISLIFNEKLDLNLVQKSLDTIMNRTNYFNMKLVQTEEGLSFRQNNKPCVVYSENITRKIPEDTNDYLFYVRYEAYELHIYSLHSLTDGNGLIALVKELIKEYFNKKNNVQFICKNLKTDLPPKFNEIEMLPKMDGGIKLKNTIPISYDCSICPKKALIKIKKSNIINKSLIYHVKPVSYLMYLMCLCIKDEITSEDVPVGFPIDVREALNTPNALYNCIVLVHNTFNVADSNVNLLYDIDYLIKHCMEDDVKKSMYMEASINMSRIFNKKWTLNKKKKTVQFMRRLASPYLLFSYLGNPFSTEEKEIEKLIKDFRVETIDYPVPLLIEEVTYNDMMNFYIVGDKCQNFKSKLKHILTINGIEFI